MYVASTGSFTVADCCFDSNLAGSSANDVYNTAGTVKCSSTAANACSNGTGICSFAIPTPTPTGNSTRALVIGGSCGGAALAALILGAAFVSWRKRRTGENQQEMGSSSGASESPLRTFEGAGEGDGEATAPSAWPAAGPVERKMPLASRKKFVSQVRR